MSTTGLAISHSTIMTHFQELKKELVTFNSVFEQWLGDRRKVMADDKNAYLKTLEEELDTVEALKRQYTQLVQKRQGIVAALATEQAEFEEAHKANAELSTQLKSLQQKLGQLRKDNDQIEAEIIKESKLLEQKEKNAQLEEEAKMTKYKLFEERLGLNIKTAADRTTLIFTCIDKDDWDRKFMLSFNNDFQVSFMPHCDPPIPELDDLTAQLKKDFNFFQFIKRVRLAFVKLVNK